MKRVLQKSSRIVRRASWSTKLSLRLSFTLKRKGCRDQENSPEAQQQQATTESKEVAGMQQECRDSAQELSRTQRQDGKQDAWNGHAQVALQAKAVPEEYEPDAERQEVRRDEQEFRTAQQQVKKMTQARAWSEGSAIINEYESDKTMPTKQFSQQQTWRNHSLYVTTKEVDKKLRVSGENESINENELAHAI